jgi:radical SAM protein with 4Fe4S-binding SPASM domain
MIFSDTVQIYLKTTETCNLNCDHCFTSGSKGKKIFFNVEKSLDFVDRLFAHKKFKYKRILFHGGEPMLAPIKDMKEFYASIKDKYPETFFGIQTNLAYTLTDERLNFLNELFIKEGMGTSWDHRIRFDSIERQLLWERNVRLLVDHGHNISVMVSMNKALLQDFEPIDIIQYLADLGVKHILFERITSNGNAKLNTEIHPENKDIDAWFLKMYEQTIEHNLYDRIHNMFLEEIANTYVSRIHSGNRCRNCEQSLITINADGTISGCPNSAPEEYWGNIEWSLQDNLTSKKRLYTMACELKRNDNCITCPVNSICNGDCHRLPWQGDICAAPKSLMIKMKNENKIEDYQKLIW